MLSGVRLLTRSCFDVRRRECDSFLRREWRRHGDADSKGVDGAHNRSGAIGGARNETMRLRISDCGLWIETPANRGRTPKSAIRNPHSAIRKGDSMEALGMIETKGLVA